MKRNQTSAPPYWPRWQVLAIFSRNARLGRFVGAAALLALWLGLGAVQLAAETNATPGAASPDFGSYLAEHQDDVTPFFEANGSAINAALLPVLGALASHLLVVGLIAGFVFDLVGGRVFSSFFALAYATLGRALVHAVARGILSVVLIALVVTAFVLLQGSTDWVYTVAGIALLAGVGGAYLQVREVRAVYRTNLVPAIVLSAVSLGAWLIVTLLVAGPLFRTHAPEMFVQFENQAIVPRLKDEIDAKKRELSKAREERGSAQQNVDADVAQVASAQAEEKDLKSKMDAWEHSDAYVYSNIGPVRARGDLESARDLYASFLAQFPNSPLVPAAHQQVMEIAAAIAARSAQDQATIAQQNQAIAAARADLLAKLKAGKATLSEMRLALLGKSRNDVEGLLGAPTEIASDSWGYGQPMIFNPLSNETTGLAIYFSTGLVQGVGVYNAP